MIMSYYVVPLEYKELPRNNVNKCGIFILRNFNLYIIYKKVITNRNTVGIRNNI